MLTLSGPSCSLKGQPPLTATTAYSCTASQPIWALVSLYTQFGGGIDTRDRERDHRRGGPPCTIIDDEFDTEAPGSRGQRNSALGPGEDFSTVYTLSAVAKDGIQHSDNKKFGIGKSDKITLKERRWKWMFEDGIPVGLDLKARRKILSQEHITKGCEDSSATFETVD